MTRTIAHAFLCLLTVAVAVAAHAAPPASPKGPEGHWLGTLAIGQVKLRLVFHVVRRPDGALSSTVDSLDQSARGIPVEKTTFLAPMLRLDIRQLGASFEGKLDGDTLVGALTQGQVVPLSLKRVDAEAFAPPKRPQEPKRPFPYREEEVTLQVAEAPLAPKRAASSVTLAGTLTLPPGKGPFPAMLFVTGSGPEDRDETVFDHKPFLVISDALTRAGIATLRFDDRGTGKSGGTLAGLTTLDFVEDTLAEIDLLAHRPEIDPRALGIIGHSEGGVIAPIAATRDRRVAFVVMLAGTGMTGDKLLVEQNALLARAAGVPEARIATDRAEFIALSTALASAHSDGEIAAAAQSFIDADPAHKAEREAAAQRLRSPWLHAFLTLDPIPYLEKVRVPVLAISGEKDLQVPKDNLPLIEAALRRAKNRDATTKLLPGLNHLFQHATTGAPSEYAALEETFAPEALELVTHWVVERSRRATGKK